LVASLNGVITDNQRRFTNTYQAIIIESPSSDLAPDITSLSRHVLMALGDTTTTAKPSSNSRSTNRPSRRSIPTITRRPD
jgi:hypothetical protein